MHEVGRQTDTPVPLTVTHGGPPTPHATEPASGWHSFVQNEAPGGTSALKLAVQIVVVAPSPTTHWPPSAVQ